MQRNHDRMLRRTCRSLVAITEALRRVLRQHTRRTERPSPAYIAAFRKWERETYLRYDAAASRSDLQHLADTMDWCMCHYCAGPCGDCKRKYADEPYPCEPCPQTQFGITECSFCPFQMFQELHHLRSE